MERQMKKQIFYLASVALAAGLAACSSDELEGENSALKITGNQLGAKIEASTANTRVAISDTYQLTWNRPTDGAAEAIGVYSSATKSTDNYKYELVALDDEAPEYGKFAPATGVEVADDYEPAVAYYPYGDQNGEKVQNGKLYLYLDPKPTYEAGIVKAPMVGDVDGSSINFKTVTAILKVRVENMPYTGTSDYDQAILTTNGRNNIAGKAYVDLKQAAEDRVLETTNDIEANSITYSFTNSKTGVDYDFYYIIPEGEYDELNFSLNCSSDTGSDPQVLVSKKTLNAVANHIYTKTLRYDSAAKAWESTEIEEINNALALGEKTVSKDLSALTNTANTIKIPTSETAVDSITLNLSNLNAKGVTITTEGKGEAPKKVIINTSTSSGGSGNGVLTIDLPKSSVQLGALEDAGVTLTSVTYSTAPNVLRIKSGVKISTLAKTTSSGTGNVYVENGVVISTFTNPSDDTYLFYQTASDVTSITGEKIIKAENAIYELLYPVVNGKPALTENFTLKVPIEIDVTGVELNLGGNTLTAADGKSAIIVKNGGSLTIIDNPASTEVKATGAVAGNGETSYAIEVQKGGSVTVSAGNISSASGNGVTVTGGTFTLNGGTISASASGKYAISLSNGATATINSASVISDSKKVAVEGDIKAEKNDAQGATASTLNLDKGTVAGVLTLTASNLKVNGGTLAGASTSAATVTATAGAAITVESGEISASKKEAVSLNASSLTVNGGTITESNTTATDAIVDASEATESTIKITDGTISSKAGVALNITADDVVTVTGGTITGKTSAVDVKKGTLTVEGDGAPAFTGDNVIASTPTNDREAVITLKAAKATYVAEDYVIYNSASPTAAKKVSLTVEGGYFTGDIKTDDTNYFIGGGFFKNCDTLEKDDASKYFVSGYKLSASINNEGFYEVVKK
jgi:hypothetical protein